MPSIQKFTTPTLGEIIWNSYICDMLGAPVTWTLTVLYGQESVRLLFNLRNAGDRGITVSEARDAVCNLIDCVPTGSFSLYAMPPAATVYRGWLPLWDNYELLYYRDHISANFPLLLVYHETPIYYQNQPPISYGIRHADPIPRPIAPALNAQNFTNPAAIAYAYAAASPAAYAVHPTAFPHAAGYVLNRPAGFHLPPTGLQPIPPTTTTTAYTYANGDTLEE